MQVGKENDVITTLVVHFTKEVSGEESWTISFVDVRSLKV